MANLKLNIITMLGGFSKETLPKIFESLDRSPYGPYIIKLTGPGGMVNTMLTVADILASYDVPVTIISRGVNGSANARFPHTSDFIRLCYPSSKFVFHSSTFGSNGTIEAIEDKYENAKATIEGKLSCFAKHFGITKRQAAKYNNHEFAVNAEDALNTGTKGIVDGIIIKDFGDGRYLIKTRNGNKLMDAKIHRRGDLADLPVHL